MRNFKVVYTCMSNVIINEQTETPSISLYTTEYCQCITFSDVFYSALDSQILFPPNQSHP